MKQNIKKHTITARVTDEELEVIKERAKEKNISISRYMVEAALSPHNLTISAKREIYREIEIIKDAARYQENQNIRTEIIERGCNAVWLCL